MEMGESLQSRDFGAHGINGELISIDIRSDDKVNSIAWNYRRRTVRNWPSGGAGGAEYNFKLFKDEDINSFWIWTGDAVNAIQFQTTQGRQSPKYGGRSGKAYLWSSIDKDSNTSTALVGFFGRSNGFVETLHPSFSSLPPRQLPMVIWGPIAGGVGGDFFDMCAQVRKNPLDMAIESITVWSGDVIDAIQVYFRNSHPSGKCGGKGGSMGSFSLSLGEWIVKVHGRAGHMIEQLNFTTNLDNEYSFGGPGGSEFTWESPNPESMGLVAFQGRCGDMLDYLAPVWAHRTLWA